ncbi:MAG: LytR C-terminal domain-containing protein [Geminicoccaceae bacterium]
MLHTGAAAPRQLVAGREHVSSAESESPRSADTSWAVEISNGAGRSRMAARMGSFLRGKDAPVKRLTNADNFAHLETLVMFRRGQEAHASWIAALLPISTRTVPVDRQAADVRVLLGQDLATFDRDLLAQDAGS